MNPRMDTLLIFLKDDQTRKLRRVDVAAAYRPADRLPAAIIQSFEPNTRESESFKNKGDWEGRHIDYSQPSELNRISISRSDSTKEAN